MKISEHLADKNANPVMSLKQKFEVIRELRTLDDTYLVEVLRTTLMEIARRRVIAEETYEFADCDPSKEIGILLDLLKESL